MDLKEIQELIKIVDESKLTTLELEQEGFKIVLKKEVDKIISKEMVQGVYTGQLTGGQVGSEKLLSAGAGSAEVASEKDQIIPRESNLSENQTIINSPIVGTFYASSSPDEEPFVQQGVNVKKGDTLCIIEAMKLMNEIEADEDFQIIDILAKDGQMVEYGQALFVVNKI